MSDKTETAIGEIKTLIVDLNQTVKDFDMKLDRVEKKLTNMVEEVKHDVVKAIKDLKGTHDQIGSLREDHGELERGVAAMEIQLNELENHKLELVRKNIESSLSELREKQILLEKHERKYNVLIYGIDEKKDENITDCLHNFMINDLDIEKKRAERIPIANAHRIPSKSRSKGPNPIIIRFIHYGDKQFIMSRGNRLAGKKICMLDDLPPVMKDARNVLANMAYKIRKDEKLKTCIRVADTHVILETRLNSNDRWQCRKDLHV